jgi:hypothetical protein
MDERAALAHRNLMSYCSLAARHTPGGEVSEGDGELLFASPHRFPFANGVMRDHERDDADRLIARAREFFDARRPDGPEPGGFSLFARGTPEDSNLERAAEAAGMSLVLDHYPQMVCERRLDEAPLPPGAEVREVRDRSDAAAFWSVCGEAYTSLGFPADLFSIYRPEFLIEPPVVACLGLLEGEPVATAMLAVLDRVGFIGWVGALERARRKGLGAACTVWVTNRAFEEGARFASLQASPMGESIYARLGYEELFTYHLWGAGPF